MPLPYVIKLGKDLTSELDILLVINHSYHVYFSIYVASLLLSFEQPPLLVREGEASSSDLASLLNQHAEWEDKYKTKAQDLAGHQLQHFTKYPYNADQLIRLKIFMRQTEHSPRTRSWNVNVAEQST